MSSKGKSKLDKQAKELSDKESKYECKICQKCFGLKADLNRHIKCVHGNEKPFKCEICQSCFGTLSNLNRHKIELSTKMKSYLNVTFVSGLLEV